MAAESIRATEIRIRRASRCLELDYEDGFRATLRAEYLRVESPSAEVRGHSPGERVWVPGKRDVNIDRVDPIGHYAVRIVFTDGHDTGIYTWAFLRTLAEEEDRRWATYLQALAARRLSREMA